MCQRVKITNHSSMCFMKKFIRKACSLITALLVLGVLWVHLLSKDAFLANFNKWYFYSTAVLMSGWVVSMAGLFVNKHWAYFLAIAVLVLHQVTLVISGAWQLNQVPMLVLPVLILWWFKGSSPLIRRSV